MSHFVGSSRDTSAFDACRSPGERRDTMVTHDLHEATGLADRILVMTGSPGRIVAEIPVPGPPTQRSEAALAPLRDELKSLLLENAP